MRWSLTVPLRRRSSKSAVEEWPPTRLPARPPSAPRLPAWEASAASIIALEPCSSGGIMLAVDLYCLGMRKAMARLTASDIAVARARSRRLLHSSMAREAQCSRCSMRLSGMGGDVVIIDLPSQRRRRHGGCDGYGRCDLAGGQETFPQ